MKHVKMVMRVSIAMIFIPLAMLLEYVTIRFDAVARKKLLFILALTLVGSMLSILYLILESV